MFYIFIPNNSYARLLNIESNNLVTLEIYNAKFDEVIRTFTDQNGRLLDLVGKVNLAFLINR